MRPERVLELLEQVAAGHTSAHAALESLAWLPVEAVGDDTGDGPLHFARVDHHREVRLGFPEAVFCPGKTVPQVVEICHRLAQQSGGFLATRADDATRHALHQAFPRARVNDPGRIVHLAHDDTTEPEPGRTTVLIAAAGTADLPVAEEAAVTAQAFGNPVERLYDVGVAGLHRLLQSPDSLRRAGIVIAVAGMDGALPSVIGGLVACPVIAVPTSTGYGAALGGIAALLAMLNSCASGVTVVNIDNGFGAACAATRINRSRARVADR
jgi:NCAIR mutase (PurE)-related protein